MEKFTLILMLFIATIACFSQEKENQDFLKQNELKINMSNLIGFKWLDVGYERILNEESSFGVGTLFSLDPTTDGLDEYRTFSITPYYRHFFSNKYARGFFVEVFTMLHSGKEDYDVGYADFPPYGTITLEEKYIDFAAGISVGGKFVSKRGFVAEIYAGIGRDLLGNSDIEIVGRGGASIGYRF
jgi:hypothetical protein